MKLISKIIFIAILWGTMSCVPSFNVPPTVIKELTIEEATIKWLGRSTAYAEAPDLITIEEDGQIDTICIAQNIVNISTCIGTQSENIKIGFVGTPMKYGQTIDIPKTIGKYNIIVDTCYIKNTNTPLLAYHHGGILSKEVATWGGFGDIQSRITLSKDEVQAAENILFNNIEYLKLKEAKYDYLISEHLDEYMRQYLGIINEKGETIVWINFISEESFSFCKDILDENIIIIKDGGSYFWSIYVNVTTGKVHDISINGIA